MENKADFFNKERGESELYATCALDLEVMLPVTRSGFEALMARACGLYELPIDDSIRSVLSGYVHHLSNDIHKVTVQQIAGVLYKSISNALTWTIDQEVKAKARAEQEALKAKFIEEAKEKQAREAVAKAEEKRSRKGKKGASRVTIREKQTS